MRMAVIENGIVANVIEAEPDFEIPGKTLIPAETAGPGWRYEDGAFIPPEPDPEPVPAEVTKLQLSDALEARGLWEAVKQAIAQQDARTQERWTLAQAIRRTDPLVTQIGSGLDLSESDMDAVFREAAAL